MSQQCAAPQITKAVADYTMGLRYADLSEEALAIAKHCLLDWIGVTVAGCKEPAAQMLIEQAELDGGAPQATIVGDGRRFNTAQVALINGTSSHALDYDDVHNRLAGHPSVSVAPVVFALGERDARSGMDVLTAFAAGVEAECRIGAYIGITHYEKGWHSTGTIGTFGAAVAASHLMGLDGDTCALGIGIASTQASGLKCMIGTMCKPLHAGKAAQNGLFSASMAARGFTSQLDALERHQGFAHTQSEAPSTEAGLMGLGEGRFEICDTLFKYHAACYGTHATIEAAQAIQKGQQIDPSKIASIEVVVQPMCLDFCNIQTPATGLESKFSQRFCVALAIMGEDTACLESYSDDNAHNPVLIELLEKVVVSGRAELGRGEAEVTIHTIDGSAHCQKYHAGIPATDLSVQWDKLVEKFRGLCEPAFGKEKTERVIEMVASLETLSDISTLVQECY